MSQIQPVEKPEAEAVKRFRSYWLEHSAAIRAYCRRLISNPADAESIFLETFHDLWEVLSKEQSLSNPRGWLRRVAYCKRNKLLERRRREREHLDKFAAGRSEFCADETVRVDAKLCVQVLLQKLEPAELEVVQLLLKGLSHKEAAAELKVAPTAFAMRLTRMRQQLKAKAEQLGIPCPVLIAGPAQAVPPETGGSLSELRERLQELLRLPTGDEPVAQLQEVNSVFHSKVLQPLAAALMVVTAALGIAIPSITLDSTPAVNAADPTPPKDEEDLSGVYIEKVGGGICRIIKQKHRTYTMIDEHGKVARDVVIDGDAFEAFNGVRGRVVGKEREIIWGDDNNRWLSNRSQGAHVFFWNRGHLNEVCLAKLTASGGLEITDERGSNSLVEFADDCSLRFRAVKWTGSDGKALQGEFKAPQVIWSGGHWERKAAPPVPVVVPGKNFEVVIPLDPLFKPSPKPKK